MSGHGNRYGLIGANGCGRSIFDRKRLVAVLPKALTAAEPAVERSVWVVVGRGR